VRLRLQQSGGFAAIPGLSKPVEVDTARLGPDESAVLESLVHRTGFLEGPVRSATPATGADLREYTLTVVDRGAVTTVHFRDPLVDPAVATLVEQLQSYRST
jgi:hypothetical protein